MNTFLLVLAVVCLLTGIAGCFLPVLPGPPLCYVGMLLAWWGKADLTDNQLLLWGCITVVVTILDYLLPVWFTKRFGGSKAAAWGSMIGLLIGLPFGLPGILLGPFFGALAGELLHDHTDSARAFKAAMGSFVAFLSGTGLKLITCAVMAFMVVKAMF